MIGQRFGRFTVIAQASSRRCKDGRNRTYWQCRCDCGAVKDVGQSNLRSGAIQSCGCKRREAQLHSVKTVLRTRPPACQTFGGFLAECLNLTAWSQSSSSPASASGDGNRRHGPENNVQ